MSTQRPGKGVIFTTRQRQFYRWMLLAISVVCLTGALVFTFAPTADGLPQSSASDVQATKQTQINDTDRLTQKCFQLLQQSNYQKMVATCTEALNAAKEVGDRRSETYARINLSTAYGSLGQYTKAIDQAQTSLDLAQRLGDQQAETYALINLGNAHQSAGQHAEAIDYSQRALSLAQTSGDRQSAAYALINLASAHWSRQDYAKTVDDSKASLQLAQKLGDRPGETAALINLSSAYGALQDYSKTIHYARQALALSQTAGHQRSQALALSNLGYGLFGQQQLSEAETALRHSIDVFESLRPTLADAEKLSLLETLTDPYHTLQRVLVAQGNPAEALEISERGRTRALVDRLAQRQQHSAGKSLATAPPAITLADIQTLAHDQGVTLVEYAMPSTEQLYIWVVSPTGALTFRSVELKALPQGLGQIIHAANASLAHSSHHAHHLDTQSASDYLQQLHQVLIAPIQDLLPTHPESHVVFVPQGSLFLVPFAALQSPNGTYLIEHHTLRTASSIQALQLLQPHNQPSRPIETALVIGNPTGDLPAAEQEAKAIARLLRTVPLLRHHAHKAAVLEQMPQADVIHIAAHAASNTVSDSYSGLMVLADPNTGFSNLTSQDILGLPLRAELAVLSGCSTGVSDRITSDGAVGLARALMTAGVPSVLMSLWRVHDSPTAALMQAFYQHWRPPVQPASGLISTLPMFGLLGLSLSLSSSFRLHRQKRAQGHWLQRLGFKTSHPYGFMAAVLFSLSLLLTIGLSRPTQTIPQSSLDKAQALRQAMLTTMQTHPNPRDWAAFTLMGTAT